MFMSTMRLIDDQIRALPERPLAGLFSELTHPLKLDTRRSRTLDGECWRLRNQTLQCRSKRERTSYSACASAVVFMLSRLSIIILMLLAGLPADAATLKGVVIANEMGGSGMDNVSVSVDDAGPKSTVSKDGGKFAFEFPDKKAGEVVHVRMNKEGYAVVNDVQLLDVTIPANPDAKLLTIIACREADREKWAGLLYQVTSDKAIEATYQQKLKALEDEHRADAAALVQLQKERDQAKAAAEKASEQLAKSQPGQNTELYQQAKQLFLEGKIEEASKLLGDNDEKRRKSVAQAKQAIEQQKKVIENAVQEWCLRPSCSPSSSNSSDAEKAY